MTSVLSNSDYTLEELTRETAMGGTGGTKDRSVPRIDLTDFEQRKTEIADQIWQASTEDGFFQIVNHDIPNSAIHQAFDDSARFFALDHEVKERFPLIGGTNAGWEYKAQFRPSTGTPDQKESYQVTRPRMAGLWPSDEEIDGFKDRMLAFEQANWSLAMQVLSCFALKLGFDQQFFTDRHDPSSDQYQSTLRLLHYLPMDTVEPYDPSLWRAGAHTDFDCLTLLHQRPGQGGLQVCPGKEKDALEWTEVEPADGVITCNIGDMLMRWSDDLLLSNLHRVRMPKVGEPAASRYSIAFFAQANKDAVIQGPEKRYEPITAHDYLQQRIAANFARK